MISLFIYTILNQQVLNRTRAEPGHFDRQVVTVFRFLQDKDAVGRSALSGDGKFHRNEGKIYRKAWVLTIKYGGFRGKFICKWRF